MENNTKTEADYTDIDTDTSITIREQVFLHLLTCLTQMLTGCAIILVWSAEQWLTVGYGLNPFIALPLATIALLLPYAYSTE